MRGAFSKTALGYMRFVASISFGPSQKRLRRHCFPTESIWDLFPFWRSGAAWILFAPVAQRFPSLRVLGIDRSSRLVSRAQARASSNELTNCLFLEGDVECLSAYFQAVDAVISSRLLLVVSNRRIVVAEMFRVLKPGGRLFLAEPTANFKTQLPLSAMRLVTRLMRSWRRQRLPTSAEILASQDFEELVRSQPWKNVSIQMYGDYQCAICEKSSARPEENDCSRRPQSDILTSISRSLA